MRPSASASPSLDPTPIFELFRGNYATELLTAAVAHFDLFGRLAPQPMTFDALRNCLELAERPATVLFVALRAMGLLEQDGNGLERPTRLAQEFLVPGGQYYIGGYIGLSAQSPAVLEMVERLRTDRPVGAKPDEEGVAFIYRAGLESAMEREATARHFTLALAGRAKNVAPRLAELQIFRSAQRLLDVGGGTGIYSIACLERNPRLQAIVWDRPEVLKVALELAHAHGVADRLECRAGDMFDDPVPTGCDVILLSNVLHDWDPAANRRLIARCAAALVAGGQLAVHDVFLNDRLDGPLPIALYSAALFAFTEGRAYSAGEYRAWLIEAGLMPGEILPTLVHCGVLPAAKL
jgi:SAM-dependent methyltransferase